MLFFQTEKHFDNLLMNLIINYVSNAVTILHESWIYGWISTVIVNKINILLIVTNPLTISCMHNIIFILNYDIWPKSFN